jgi:hypothetical protein
MGLHLCPIEPNDWTDGPEGGEEGCERCGGSGVRMLTMPGVEGQLPIPCECTERDDPQPEWDDVI